jgi:hypothetical protein
MVRRPPTSGTGRILTQSSQLLVVGINLRPGGSINGIAGTPAQHGIARKMMCDSFVRMSPLVCGPAKRLVAVRTEYYMRVSSMEQCEIGMSVASQRGRQRL